MDTNGQDWNESLQLGNLKMSPPNIFQVYGAPLIKLSFINLVSTLGTNILNWMEARSHKY